jgi:hypothetical protein
MLFSLDDTEALDPAVSGAKAAWLARARQEGMPVLPGIVVAATHAQRFLDLGMEFLETHGSGRARIAITSSPFPDDLREEITLKTGHLPEPMVVRSSSTLEGSGEWSGAFTSYLDIRHGEVPKAVVGCYASAFTQHTVERFAAADLSPARAAMAVLVQPALDPAFGGTARISADEVIVTGVAGSPAPLVQGWEPGAQARVTGSVVNGGEAVDLMSEDLLRRIANTLLLARDRLGANNCEWAVQGDEIWLLQLQKFDEIEPGQGIHIPESFRTELVADTARLIRRHPGPLAEEIILPWAIADPSLADVEIAPADLDPAEALKHAVEQASALTAEVWNLPKPDAAAASRTLLRELRGTDPDVAAQRLARLRPPDRDRAVAIMSAMATVRHQLRSVGAVSDQHLAWHIDSLTARRLLTGELEPTLRGRIGFDRWDPFNAAVVAAHGAAVTGTSVSNGIAFGRMCIVTDPAKPHDFRPRDIVVGVHPVPGLAALLFDAAGIITTGGGTAAHLFESARALAIPALCATRIEDLIGSSLEDAEGEWALTVDGSLGTVHAVPW